MGWIENQHQPSFTKTWFNLICNGLLSMLALSIQDGHWEQEN
jgi:hypothetical protein